jgi:hypothetical protein
MVTEQLGGTLLAHTHDSMPVQPDTLIAAVVIDNRKSLMGLKSLLSYDTRRLKFCCEVVKSHSLLKLHDKAIAAVREAHNLHLSDLERFD